MIPAFARYKNIIARSCSCNDVFLCNLCTVSKLQKTLSIMKYDNYIRLVFTNLTGQINNIYDKFGYSIVLSPILISYDFFNEWKNDLPFYKNVVSEGVKIVA